MSESATMTPATKSLVKKSRSIEHIVDDSTELDAGLLDYLEFKGYTLTKEIGVGEGRTRIAVKSKYSPLNDQERVTKISRRKIDDSSIGFIINRILKYDSNVPTRGGLVGANNPCDCTRGDIHEWLHDLKGHYSSFKEKGDGK